jgi:hypothetical protein
MVELYLHSPLILQGRPCHSSGVSRRLPTTAARVRAHFRSCGQIDTGAGFLPVFRFPLSILIPPNSPHLSSIIRGWYNRPNSGRHTKWTQSHPHPKKLKKKKNWQQNLTDSGPNCAKNKFKNFTKIPCAETVSCFSASKPPKNEARV